MRCLAFFTALAAVLPRVAAFGRAPLSSRPRTSLPSSVEAPAPNASPELSARASKLKQVLEKEYITFFDPMVTSWYAPDVSFRDPMTSLSGVDSCENQLFGGGQSSPATARLSSLTLRLLHASRSEQR